MATLRSKLVTAAAVGAAAVGGAGIANAASSTTTSSSASATPTAAQQHSGGRHTVNGKTEKALTGDVAAKVKAAALAKVAGTVERVETNVDGSAPYEAHITKSDGTSVEVQVNSDYTVAAVNTMGGHH
jgi:uncharacterized membrane protein YkoI